jgi:aspartate/tyrosine/aromatic aminotransferase
MEVAALDKSGELFIGGVKPTVTQMEELGSEAMLMEKMELWNIMTNTVRALANDLGIKQAKDFDQLMFAKAMLHVVGLQEDLLSRVKKEYNIFQEAKSLASRVAK